MKIGLIGLGRMGAGMARRLARAGVAVAAWDVDAEARAALASEDGVTTASSLDDLCAGLEAGSRVIAMMLPAGEAVDATLRVLRPLAALGLLPPA